MADESLNRNNSGGRTMAGEFDSRLTVLERQSWPQISSIASSQPKRYPANASIIRQQINPIGRNQ
jgi:hypothetical protein